MQITLDQTEIEAAIKAYIKDQGLNFGVKEPEVSLTAGRGPNGITASVDLVNSTIVKIGPGEVEVLNSKPKADLSAFQPEPEEAPKSKPEPVKQVKAQEVVTDVVDDDDDALFMDEEDEPVTTEVTADSLFAV